MVPFFDPLKHKAYLLKGKTWVNNHAHVLKGLPGIDNRYLCYYLNQVDYHGFVNGATRLKLTQANMRKLSLNIAPTNEQICIADKLDSILAKSTKPKHGLKNTNYPKTLPPIRPRCCYIRRTDKRVAGRE